MLIFLIWLFLLHILVNNAPFSTGLLADDLTYGFTNLPLNTSFYHFHKPYNIPLDQRYCFINGVQKLWVYSSDKPFSKNSPTRLRTEVIVKGYEYSSDVWQFEGYFYVSHGTKGVSIMQIFGAAKHATTLMLMVNENGALAYYRTDNVIVSHVYDRWFKLNVIHEVKKNKVQVYINGHLKFEAPGRGGKFHYFKYGVYAQNNSSSYMESLWKRVRIFRK